MKKFSEKDRERPSGPVPSGNAGKEAELPSDQQIGQEETGVLLAGKNELGHEQNLTDHSSGLSNIESPLLRHLDEPALLLAGKQVPVYLTEDYKPVLNSRLGCSIEKVFICSIPKSGSHLYALLLELLGIEPTGAYLGVGQFADRRFWSAEEFREKGKSELIGIPIRESIKLIRPGQYAYGHVECSWVTVDLVDQVKILFVYRNIRDVLVSHMRWTVATAWGTKETEKWRHMPDSPEKMLRYLDDIGPLFIFSRCYALLGWLTRPEVLCLSFEQIYGDLGLDRQIDTISQVQEFCGIENMSVNPHDIISNLIGKPTLTWSGSRSRWRDCWNDEVESRFVDIGGKDLNRRLGYDEGVDV